MKPIIKTLVPDDERLDTLPRVFGDLHLSFEIYVYSYMDRFCPAYNGGYWDFYTLSNGGFYMSLREDRTFTVENPEAYFREEMTADAASIGVNLFALGRVMSDNQEHRLVERWSDIYHALRQFATREHPEGAKIFSFTD